MAISRNFESVVHTIVSAGVITFNYNHGYKLVITFAKSYKLVTKLCFFSDFGIYS